MPHPLFLALCGATLLVQEPAPTPEPVTISVEGIESVAVEAPPAETPQEPTPEVAPEPEGDASGPRPTDTADWQQWERLGAVDLSPDGRWMAWQVSRNDGTQELRVRMLATDADKVFEQGGGPEFSPDSRWMLFRIVPSEAEREKDKDAKAKVGILDLMSGEDREVEGATSFELSECGRWLAMRRETKRSDGGGADLVLHDLHSGVDVHFGAVGSFAWSEAAPLLAMTVDAPEQAGNGVRVYDAASGLLRTLDSAAADYVGLNWREDAADLAVMRTREFEDDEDATHVVLAWRGLGPDAAPAALRRTAYDMHATEGTPDMRVVDYAGLRWSDDGGALFFGLKEWENRPENPAVSAKDAKDAKDEKDEGADDDKEKGKGKSDKDKDDGKKPLRETLKEGPGVEVWHADDIDILPRQKITALSDGRENFLVVLHLDSGALVQLEDELVESVRLLEGQRWAIGYDESPYEEEQRFSATYRDLYRVDVRTGERTKLLDRVKYSYIGDPEGRTILVQRDGHLWSHDLESGAQANLTARVDVPFINQENSSLTDEKPPYGVQGWTTDGRVILATRYDLWAFALDGSGVQRLTNGTAHSVRHRIQRVDREAEEFLAPDRPVHVSLYGDLTKRSGYGRLTLAGDFQELVYEDAHVSRLAKAEGADVFAYVRERFDDSPDVFVGGAGLADARQFSHTNAQAKDFLWGHAELIDYTNARGEAMQGALYYPAGWEEGKQYPMITYIYELESQELHRYAAPSETSPYNPAVYTSQGYFVFSPDITYRAQFPGVSASECVIPAVQSIIDRGLVDKDRIGLVGHSWGAYQTAFLVTQTDLFAAGVAGAPLTNMMSMSMSIYWNSGQTDAYIFHESQGRMDRPFWQDVETYIANSPIFHIDKMNTPLLVAFGDEDGAVDWHQGIEMYNAARLARKPMVMLVYAGENHSLREKPNRVDYHHRVREWFDHYLKGVDAPAWITEGQSYLELQKEREEREKKNGKGGGRGR